MSDVLSKVLGQDTAVTTLRRGLARSCVHHAFLFEGPAGVGKELAAFGLAQALVCEKRAPGGDTACGECSACKRALPSPETRIPLHPDVTVLEMGLHPPERIGKRTPETQEISIDQVRALVLSRASFGPHEGRAKVFIVRRADELSTSASNALLKTLEEPLDRTHFILLCDERELLPTIRSRTLRLRFQALSNATVTRVLAGRGHTQVPEAVLNAAQGSVIRALAMLDREHSAENDAFYKQWTSAIASPSLESALVLAEAEKKDKALAISRLEFALAQTGAEVRAAANSHDEARIIAKLAVYGAVSEALEDIDRNASPQLALEAALMAARTGVPKSPKPRPRR